MTIPRPSPARTACWWPPRAGRRPCATPPGRATWREASASSPAARPPAAGTARRARTRGSRRGTSRTTRRCTSLSTTASGSATTSGASPSASTGSSARSSTAPRSPCSCSSWPTTRTSTVPSAARRPTVCWTRSSSPPPASWPTGTAARGGPWPPTARCPSSRCSSGSRGRRRARTGRPPPVSASRPPSSPSWAAGRCRRTGG
mmetsp:Transcript_25280/g.71292  ORF Transcript_25280/g.71292 Transcript_25280/m.71292 type:complete len:203 (-) Transcript_25280:674-1282(-)